MTLENFERFRRLVLFELEHTSEDVERVRHASQFHAKNPALFFEDDSQTKRREAGEMLRHMAERYMRPTYEELEAVRRAQEEEQTCDDDITFFTPG